MTPTILSKPSLVDFLISQGIDFAKCTVMAPDVRYALPARDWIEREFAGALQMFRDEQIAAYAPEDSDCDDYAECAAFFARFLHRHTKDRPKHCGLAFAEWFYQQGGSGFGHVINAAVCMVNGELELVHFEPQPHGGIVTLTPAEILSTAMVKF